MTTVFARGEQLFGWPCFRRSVRRCDRDHVLQRAGAISWNAHWRNGVEDQTMLEQAMLKPCMDRCNATGHLGGWQLAGCQCRLAGIVEFGAVWKLPNEFHQRCDLIVVVISGLVPRCQSAKAPVPRDVLLTNHLGLVSVRAVGLSK